MLSRHNPKISKKPRNPDHHKRYSRFPRDTRKPRYVQFVELCGDNHGELVEERGVSIYELRRIAVHGGPSGIVIQLRQ